ncbi:gliding motility-associated C-terminal domain-containing protein [Membranicola marinus]|uniref:Gliding motility-associated C-terminal domain-containing protein n=1 Tax=Membranihabitans marinus TaxID=1227546 RepID=A0A953HSW0_9BACT|nr:gliding motility-associated C-terminal domain-containing protein [Membranihabitans marinus]MBY5957730.1 gliding motility-associated C-terminal domain-containing protein [Membranihabitans marinus]
MVLVVVNEGEPREGDNNEDDDDSTVSVPYAITPNGDGINDQLEIFSNCNIRVIEIRIFDKWGGELYRVQGGEVEASIWADFPPGVVMVQVMYEASNGVVKTAVQGVLVVM